MYGYCKVHQVDLLELANFLECAGQIGAINRWEKLKKQFTDNRYIYEDGFSFGFDDSVIKELIEEDNKYQDDIDLIQFRLNVPNDAILLCRMYSSYTFRVELSIIDAFVLTPQVIISHKINFLNMCKELEKTRKGAENRWKQVIKWQSKNYHNYAIFNLIYSKNSLKALNDELYTDALILEAILKKEKNIVLTEGDHISFAIEW